MNGVLLVDKPIGVSSHRVVSILRRVLQIKKIGHAGTLDPQASGLLILCIGQATKISQYLMGSDKVYQFDAVLGKTTTTYDDEGEVTQEKDVCVDQESINQALVNFQGWLDQMPPIYSAIKKDGKKLYQYARANQDVVIEPRKVRIDKLELCHWESPRASFQVSCSKGTYVRSIAHDLGQALSCGAHAQKIRRLRSGEFDVASALDIESLEDKEKISSALISIFESLRSNFHYVDVSESQELHIRHGKPIEELELPEVEKGMILFHSDKRSVAMAESFGDGSFKLCRVI